MPNQIPFGSKSFQERNPHLFAQTVAAATTKAVKVESELHEQIERYCTERGYLYIHSRMDAPTTIQVGTPDFAVFMPGAKSVFIECKAKGGKTTTEQLSKIAHARKLGFRAEVVDNFEDARKVMEE